MDGEHLQELQHIFNGVEDSVEVLGISKSPGEYNVFYTFGLEGMAKFILDVSLNIFREK